MKKVKMVMYYRGEGEPNPRFSVSYAFATIYRPYKELREFKIGLADIPLIFDGKEYRVECYL